MRLAVYTDYTYRRRAQRIYSERAFSLFLGELATRLEALIIAGKIDPRPGKLRYEVSAQAEFVELPFYESLTRPVSALRGMAASLKGFWGVLGRVDTVWLLGPHPLAFAFAALAACRRKRIVLGSREDFSRYIRARHPDARWVQLTGDLLQGGWRVLSRWIPVIAVGPALAALYPRARVLEIAVSLVRESDLALAAGEERSYAGGELRALSVGRLEQEKNPLLLAEILRLLRERDDRWRLVVCGEGPLEEDLRWRLAELGLSAHADLLGYVPHDAGLANIYRSSHALLHVSWTEGLPQILFEAFAARLPVVATAVGGVAAATGDAALLIGPGDAPAAADALERVATEPELRLSLVAGGQSRVREHTLEAEVRRVADFIEQAPRRGA